MRNTGPKGYMGTGTVKRGQSRNTMRGTQIHRRHHRT